MPRRNSYSSPFSNRYSSKSMRGIFSDEFKYTTWRHLWYLLAKAEKDLGLGITDEQVEELKLKIHNINYTRAEAIEKELHHDVMAHIKAYGEACPNAKPIIHLGATSCYVTDNTEILQCYYALSSVTESLMSVIKELRKIAFLNAGIVAVSYTHYQPAQPTTVGKRACMWMQDLMMDLEQLTSFIPKIKLLGCKGATGNMSSFMNLFNGDKEKVIDLERLIVTELPVKSVFPISGQTYTRKQDYYIMQILSGIAQSASKFANDIRLLSNLGEMQEPHSTGQVGSSAMPHKSNPIMCEKICSLSRFVICGEQNFAMTSANQWLERTLDDSANRRVMIPEMFLAIDEILQVYKNVVAGLEINYGKIADNLKNELPFVLEENILMYCVNKGGDRQELHERLRIHSNEAKNAGKNLFKTIIRDEKFDLTADEMNTIIDDSSLTGMAYTQTMMYLVHVDTILRSIDEQQRPKT